MSVPFKVVAALALFVFAGCNRSTAPVAAPSPTPAASPQPLTLAQAGINPAWMEPTADACQDFYAYACGGFVKTAVIPADMATWGPGEAVQKSNEEFLRAILETDGKAALEPVAKKIGDYYEACMNEEAIEKAGAAPIRPLLEKVAAIKDLKSLQTTLIELHAAGVFPLFSISSQQDFKDATRVIAGMDQAGLGLPDRDYYLKDDGDMKEVREFYRGHVGRMLGLAGLTAAEQSAAVADVMRIETAIARLQQDKVARRDPYAVYHKIDRAGLKAKAGGFPWDDYFAGLGFPQLQDVSVNDPGYFQKAVALLKSEPPAAWRHYLAWQVVRERASILSKAFVEESFAMRQKLSGQKELAPRWKRCVRATDDALGELLAQPYVAAKFAGDSKSQAREMVQEIRGAMKQTLTGLSWMDDATRQTAQQKLEKMVYKVGYPDKWRSYDFEVVRDDYAHNALAAEAFDQKRDLTKVGKPVDRTEWEMTPPTVNAYYDPSLNEMVVPAGQLQPPFFDQNYLHAVNLGATGAGTMGHELTHGFDDEGKEFDPDGNLHKWWTADTAKKFGEAIKCVQEQYSRYEAVPGVHLNGELTSGENIADIGGVKLGFAALHAGPPSKPERTASLPGYSPEQLYYLGYAQTWCSKETPQVLETMARTNPHSPPKWRVNGVVVDQPGFGPAFHCAAGTPMNPGKICAVW